MTTYYADFVNGNDANNGLGPDASHANNKPWKTIGKLGIVTIRLLSSDTNGGGHMYADDFAVA